MRFFTCIECGRALDGFPPSVCGCGWRPDVLDGVLQMTNDPPINASEDGPRWLGYENVGVNFEPEYLLNGMEEGYGVYGACSRKLAETLGDGCVVLDVGAGLGTASIPLALAGARAIAADISQVMLRAARERARGLGLEDSLVLARMNAYRMPIVSGSVDAVIELAMLHQVDRPERVVEEVVRVLKPGGVLARYSSAGLPVTEEQSAVNRACSDALRAIEKRYYSALDELGYRGRPFESSEQAGACVSERFEPPVVIQTGFERVWTGKMRAGVHKLRMRASGGAQLIPDDMHEKAWRMAEDFAVAAYGPDYLQIRGYSRYTAALELRRVRS